VAEELIGRRLDDGNYEIRDVLGRGGMATVYRAHSFPLDADVAVKVLAPRLAQDEGFRERLREEARSLYDLFHPNIVPVMALDQEGDLVYIVMRLVPRGTLKDRLNLLGVPLDLTTTARVIGQVAEALQYAHAKGLVHLDIKPANILLGGADWPLLADFGITRAIQHQQTEHGHERLAGTPAYMSPEQCRGGPIDGRSDEYSLAITAYEMLTGRRPFEAQTTEDLLQQQIETSPPRPRELNPGIPGPVEAVLLRGLAKDPNDRYPTVRAFGRALTGAVEQTRGVSLETKAALATVAPNLIGVLALILLAPFLLGSLPGVRLFGTPLPLSWPFQFFVALLVGFLLLRIRWHVVGLLTRTIRTIARGLGDHDRTAPSASGQRVEQPSTSLTGAVEGAINLAYLYGGYRLLAVPVLDLTRLFVPPSIAQYVAGGITILAILLTLGALVGIGRLAGPLVAAGVGVVALGVLAASPAGDLGLPTETRLGWSVDAVLVVAGLVALIAARFPVRRLAKWLAEQVLSPLVVVTRPTVSAADLAATRRQLSGVAVVLGDLLLLLGADVVLRPPLVTALGTLIGGVQSAIAVSGLLGLLWLVLAARLRSFGGWPGLALAALLGLPLLRTLPLLDPLLLGSTWPETVTSWVLATAATLLFIVARRPLQSVCTAAVGPAVDRRLAGVRPAPDEAAAERRVGACAGLAGGILDVGLLIVAYWLLGMPLVSALTQATGQSWISSVALGGLVLVASAILWLRLRAARAIFAETGEERWARRAGAASAMALGLAALLIAGCAALPTTLATPATERFGASAGPLDHVLVNWQFWQPDTPRSGESTYNVALSCSSGDALGDFREAFQPASGGPLPSGNIGLTDPRVNLELMPCTTWRDSYFELRQAAGLGTQPSLSWNWVDVRAVLGADGTADVVERHWVAFTEGAADHLEWAEPGDTQGAIQGLDLREADVAYPLDPTGPALDRYARSSLAGTQSTIDWFFPLVTAPAERTFTLHYRLPGAIEQVGDRKRFSRQVLLPRAGPAWRTTVAIVLPDSASPDNVVLTTSDAAASRRMLDARTAWFESKDQSSDGSLTVGIEFADTVGPTPTVPPPAAPTPTSTAIVAIDLTATPTSTDTTTPTETPEDSPTATIVSTASPAPTEAGTPSAVPTSDQNTATPRSTPTVALASATPTLSATPVSPTITVTSSPTRAICSGDEAMTFSPASPIVGQPFTVVVTASQNDANVKLSGPDNPQGFTTRTDNGKFEWYWTITPSSAGHKDYYFFAQNSTLCTTNFVVVQSPTSTPTPTKSPTPDPTPCPTLAVANFSGTRTGYTNVTVSWATSGGCGPTYSGTVTGSQYPGVTKTQSAAISAPSGSWVDTPPQAAGGCFSGNITYTLSLSDSAGHRVTATTQVAFSYGSC
jgi:serine/threonine-protein kinase